MTQDAQIYRFYKGIEMSPLAGHVCAVPVVCVIIEGQSSYLTSVLNSPQQRLPNPELSKSVLERRTAEAMLFLVYQNNHLSA